MTYLSHQLAIIRKLKLEDIARSVAAPDASPPAAISVHFPRGKEVHGITAYAMFKGQQGLPFVRYAACTSCTPTSTSGWPKLQRIGFQEHGSQDMEEEEEEELYSRMHGGKDKLSSSLC
jgi:hypothetical protein